MSVKTIGVLFGMEDTFPWALCHEINELARRRGLAVKGEPVQIGHISQEQAFSYDVILDRISHEVPFYRTFLKCAAARGVQVVNNPFWWSADDKFFDNVVARAVGVAVPRTVLLPHKEHPPNTTEQVVPEHEPRRLGRGLPLPRLPDLPEAGLRRRMEGRLQGPQPRGALRGLRPDPRRLTMMAQEAIDFTEYYRCWVVGPAEGADHAVRPEGARASPATRPSPGRPVPDEMALRVTKDALALCDALGYDMNTVEFAVRDGVPYAIDFMNCAPDADLHSVGEESFRWIVTEMAELLVERALHPVPWEPTGTWPKAAGSSAEAPSVAWRRSGGDGVRRLGAGLAILLGGALVAVSAEKPAELILRNGKVVTMDAARPEATAIAISGDRVVAVGTDAEIDRLRGEATRVIDLGGKTASPASSTGTRTSSGSATRGSPSTCAARRAGTRSCRASRPPSKKARPGEWILGRGWHQKEWASPPEPNVEGFPLHASLSAVSPANPVLLSHASGHAAFANAVALKRGGVGRDTKAPAGGEILKDASGEPTGLLRETAEELVVDALERRPREADVLPRRPPTSTAGSTSRPRSASARG